VWKATGPGDMHVALKCVRLTQPGGGLEVRALDFMKQVRHANVLPIFGAWQTDDRLLLAMQLADQTLLDRLRSEVHSGRKGIPFSELLDYMRDAAKGIDYLISVGLQHRDIKPENLFLVGGSVKVADFGLAKVLRGPAAGHSGGLTPAYAAPEFLRKQTADQSDQYSLAVTYCYLRGGVLPFEGTIEEIIYGHLQVTPKLLMLPEVERPIVARALAKEPTERWPSCRDFVEALAETVNASLPRPSSVIAKPPIQRRAAPPQVRLTTESSLRSKWLTATAVIVLLAGIGAVIYAFSLVFGEVKSEYNAQAARHPPRRPPTQAEKPITAPASRQTSPVNYAESKFNEGLLAMNRRNYEKAVDLFSTAIELEPHVSRYYVERARAYLGLERYDDAVADCTTAIQIRPTSGPAYYERGNVHAAQGDLDQAIADYDKAIELNAANPAYYENRAQIHEKMGNADKAEADRQKAQRVRGKR
jgi:serine/threonine protein kinase